MDVEKVTRTEVKRRLDRLRDTYGSFPVLEETVTNQPDFFEHGRELAEDGWIGDAGVWVTDDDRVLLIRHRESSDAWGVPGGAHEPGETMEETARRELREETGVDCGLTGVKFARRKTIVLAPNPDDRYYMLTVIFDADYEEGDLSIHDDEVLEARWFTQPPENVSELIQKTASKWRTEV